MCDSKQSRERSRSRDDNMLDRATRIHEATRVEVGSVQDAGRRRCDSQAVFLRQGTSNEVYSWEFGQPFRGANKSRWEMDRQQYRAAGHRRHLRETRMVTHDGLGVLRSYGPYNNSGPALGDLHSALRCGAGPDQVQRWKNDLFENDSAEEPCRQGPKDIAAHADRWRQSPPCIAREREASGRMRAWEDV